MRRTLALLLLCVFSTQSMARVENPVLFSGEVAANLTAGAPLSVSSTGKVASGISNTPVTFTSTITTTAACSTLIPTTVLTGITTTPAAGTYEVTFSTWLTHSTGNATVTMSIGIAGTSQASMLRTTLPFTGAVGGANNGVALSTNGIVTVNGSQAIAMLWCTTAATATAHAGEMDVVRLQ